MKSVQMLRHAPMEFPRQQTLIAEKMLYANVRLSLIYWHEDDTVRATLQWGKQEGEYFNTLNCSAHHNFWAAVKPTQDTTELLAEAELQSQYLMQQ